MSDKPEKWIFISSPGDVAAERVIADRVFRRLAKEFDDVVTLKLLLWEFEPLFAHGSFQRQIRTPAECDLMVTMLWTRLGTRLPAEFAPGPGLPPPTGTEYELREALAAHAKNGRPDVLIYVKRASASAALEADDIDERRAQYKELQEFCHQLFYDASGASVVAHHSFHDAAEFERKLLEHARKWLAEQLSAVEVRPRWTLGSPFRGLRPFEAEHRDIFFGRAHAVGELLRRLSEVEHAPEPGAARARLLLIVGMSGNGKTSLVRAGLLPQLEYLPVEGIASWDAVTLRPSDVDAAAPETGPSGALAARLFEKLGPGPMQGATVATLARELAERPAAAVARIESALWTSAASRRHAPPPEKMRLLIYIDQLEELFTLPGLAGRVDDALATITALASSPRIWVVATLRSDFLHRLEGHADLMALLAQSPPYTLLPPRGAELADMIREPALAAGLRFEERDGVSLAAEILQEASLNPESLPLLQYALEQLYEKRDGRTLLWDVYRPAGRDGGLRGSLVAVAEAQLQPGDELAFRRVMRQLTSVSEDGSATRRYASLRHFAEGTPEHALLSRLISARLCIADTQGARPVVCLAHEALLQSWPRVQRWLVQESTLLRLRDELHRDARAWEAHGRKDDWLGTAPDKLAAIGQLEREGLLASGLEEEFARRSRRRAAFNQRVKNAVIASLCTLGLVSAVAGYHAMRQRDLARREAMTAERTATFMTSLFQVADPSESRGNAITVREMLDKGARDIRAGLSDEPQVRAGLLSAMGRAYKGLGLYEPAGQLLEEALALRHAAPDDPVPLISVLNQLGEVHYLRANDDAAEQAYREALNVHAGSSDRRAQEQRAESFGGLGEVLQDKGLYPESRKMLELALAENQRLYGAKSPQVAHTLKQLGVTLQLAGDLDGGIKRLEQSTELYRAIYGAALDPALTDALSELAVMLEQKGEYVREEALFREAYAMKRKLYGERHPDVAIALANIAEVEALRGELAKSEADFRAALAMERELLGAAHPRIVEALNDLAFVLHEQGRAPEAIATEREALAVARKVYPGDQPDLVRVQANLAFWLTLARDYAAAERELKEAMAMRERLVAHGQVDDGRGLVALGVYQVATGRYADALVSAREARAALDKQMPRSWQAAAARAVEGRALLALGSRDAAAPLLNTALATMRADRGTPRVYLELVAGYAKSLSP